MNVEDWKTKMVGFGCDGASVKGGLMGLLKQELPCVLVFGKSP